MHDWWIDEVAHAGAEHLDPDYVAGYDRKAGYDPADDIAALARHGLGRDATVLDLGAGTGTFTLAVAPRCERVIAVDVSPAMVEVLRGRVAAAELHDVEVVQAGFLSYVHDGPPADFAFSRNALHQLPDFWKAIALDRIHSMVAEGGVLRLRDLVYDFEPRDAEPAMAAWMAGAVDDPARGWTAVELAEHVRLEHSTFSWLFEPMLERCGFEILEREYVRGAYGAYTLRRR
jgi:SAM-dependent methyltransferase